MFWKKKREPKVVYLGPSYKTTIKIWFSDVAGIGEFEILHYNFEDGFLICLLPNIDKRYISLSVIRSFDVIREEIKDEQKS